MWYLLLAAILLAGPKVWAILGTAYCLGWGFSGALDKTYASGALSASGAWAASLKQLLSGALQLVLGLLAASFLAWCATAT